MELDKIDQLAAKAFEGFIVRKDLLEQFRKTYPVPTYVIEFLLGRYCATTNEAEIQEGLEIVKRQLQDRTVRPGEEEYFKSLYPLNITEVTAHRLLEQIYDFTC